MRASINCIRDRYQKLDHIRHSPQNYKKVKSRVSKNIKTQENIAKSQKKVDKAMKKDSNFGVNRPSKSAAKEGIMTAQEFKKLNEQGMNEESLQKLNARDELIKQREAELMNIEHDLKEKMGNRPSR